MRFYPYWRFTIQLLTKGSENFCTKINDLVHIIFPLNHLTKCHFFFSYSTYGYPEKDHFPSTAGEVHIKHRAT